MRFDSNRSSKSMIQEEMAKALVKAGTIRDNLIHYLRWAIEHMEDGMDEVPPHDCDYVHKPEKGYCSFCATYHDAKQLLKDL